MRLVIGIGDRSARHAPRRGHGGGRGREGVGIERGDADVAEAAGGDRRARMDLCRSGDVDIAIGDGRCRERRADGHRDGGDAELDVVLSPDREVASDIDRGARGDVGCHGASDLADRDRPTEHVAARDRDRGQRGLLPALGGDADVARRFDRRAGGNLDPAGDVAADIAAVQAVRDTGSRLSRQRHQRARREIDVGCDRRGVRLQQHIAAGDRAVNVDGRAGAGAAGDQRFRGRRVERHVAGGIAAAGAHPGQQLAADRDAGRRQRDAAGIAERGIRDRQLAIIGGAVEVAGIDDAIAGDRDAVAGLQRHIRAVGDHVGAAAGSDDDVGGIDIEQASLAVAGREIDIDGAERHRAPGAELEEAAIADAARGAAEDRAALHIEIGAGEDPGRATLGCNALRGADIDQGTARDRDATIRDDRDRTAFAGVHTRPAARCG